MAIYRVKAHWTGFSGAPGMSVLHYQDFGGDATIEAQRAVDAVRHPFTALAKHFPISLRVALDSGVEVIDEATGQLQDVVTVTPGDSIAGLAGGGYAAPIGAVINWSTAGVRKGRRVRGRFFLVPLSSSAYDTDGTLTAAAHGDISAVSRDMISNEAALQVYCRPTTTGAADGEAHMVTGSRVPDKAAVLRARRD